MKTVLTVLGIDKQIVDDAIEYHDLNAKQHEYMLNGVKLYESVFYGVGEAIGFEALLVANLVPYVVNFNGECASTSSHALSDDYKSIFNNYKNVTIGLVSLDTVIAKHENGTLDEYIEKSENQWYFDWERQSELKSRHRSQQSDLNDSHTTNDTIYIISEDRCGWLINGVLITEKAFETEDYRIADREELIDRIFDYVAEAGAADRVLMKNDILYLCSLDDEYVLSSESTNEYISPSKNHEIFNKVCDGLISESEK